MDFTVQNDVLALSRIDAVQMILKTLSDLTEMRVSLVARITDESWTACAVYDAANFGLNVGDSLELSTTY